MARITQNTTIPQDYTSALNRWLQQQSTAKQQYSQAATPLQQAVEMFQPGGSFGAGQIATLEGEAKKAGAEATAQQVASGMSSGSLATSTGLRIKSDLAKAKLGVDDTRTQFLNQALGALASLRGQQASQTAAIADPFFGSYLASRTQAQGQELGYNAGVQGRNLQSQHIAQQKSQFDRTMAFNREKASKNTKSTSNYRSLQF